MGSFLLPIIWIADSKKNYSLYESKLMDNIMEEYVKACEEIYKQFMKISYIPQYKITNKVLDLQKIEEQGYGSFASAKYNVETGEHCLEVWKNIRSLGAKSVGTVFHELTHIVDNEKYVKNSLSKKIGNLCFSEYLQLSQVVQG